MPLTLVLSVLSEPTPSRPTYCPLVLPTAKSSSGTSITLQNPTALEPAAQNSTTLPRWRGMLLYRTSWALQVALGTPPFGIYVPRRKSLPWPTEAAQPLPAGPWEARSLREDDEE